MQALSKAKIKLFGTLQAKKMRQEHGLFIAEGFKLVEEALASSFDIEAIVLRSGTSLPFSLDLDDPRLHEADEAAFAKLSSQVNPEGVLAVMKYPGEAHFCHHPHANFDLQGPAFVLAGIQDPGNLGTIIRTADWFGMKAIVCGQGTVDCFNPKVLRSSMGSIFRMQLIYTDQLEAWLQNQSARVYCADMDGLPLQNADFTKRDLVVMGNEANGIPLSIRKIEGLEMLTIPRFGAAESLNAAAAAAVLAWEMRPRN